MAKVKGPLKFPINDIKNPAFNNPPSGLLNDPTDQRFQKSIDLNRGQATGGTIPKIGQIGFAGGVLSSKQAGVINQSFEGLKSSTQPETVTAGLTVARKPVGGVTTQTIDLPQTVQRAAPQERTQVTSLAKPIPTVQKAAPVVKEEVKAVEAPSVSGKPVENAVVQQAQTNIDLLSQKAKEAVLATEDPVAKMAFNNALTNIGVFNQAQRDLMQQQINQSPGLSGQPAGTAMLSMLARQQGFDVSNLITNLSIESAKTVRDLNKWGFEGLANIVRFQETQKANIRSDLLKVGDIDGFASQFKTDTGITVDVTDLKALSPATQNAIATQQNLLDATLKSGDLEAARRHFDTIVALNPKAFKGATFESLGFEDGSYLLQNAQNQQIDDVIRLNLAQDDIKTAIQGIETQFNLNERIEGGAELFNNKTLEEINAALESIGEAAVQDKTELIGREEELFTAFKIQELQKGLDKTAVDAGVDFFTNELLKLNPDLALDDAANKSIRSFVLDLNTGGDLVVDQNGNVTFDPNELVQPWDDSSSSIHLFKSWPVMDTNGNITKGDFYTESNPEPNPSSAIGQYETDLNQKWESYLMNTAKEDRVTRDAWFAATKAGTQDFDPSIIPEGLQKPEGGPEVPGTFGGELETKEDLDALTAGEWTKLMDNADKLILLEKAGVLKTFSFDENTKGVKDGIDFVTKNDIQGKILIYNINGVPTPIKNVNIDSVGEGVTFGKDNRRVTATAINLLTGEEVILFDATKNAEDFN